MDSDADRLASIKGLGGQLITVLEGGEFYAIFDNDYQAALADGSIESRGPVLTARTIDVAHLRRQSALTFKVRGVDVTYKTVKQEPLDDGEIALVMLGK